MSEDVGPSPRTGVKRRSLKPLTQLSRRQLRRRADFPSGTSSEDATDVADDEDSDDDGDSSSRSPSLSSGRSISYSRSPDGAHDPADNQENVACGVEHQDVWFDADANGIDPNCVECSKCLCLDCDLCCHSSTACKHCDRCQQGRVVYESNEEPLDSDNGFWTDDGNQCEGHESEGSVEGVNEDSSGESSEEGVEGLASSLRQWVNTFKVTFRAVSALLKILAAAQILGLPKDARTLMKTPRSTAVRPMFSGTYWHNGFAKCLQQVLKGTGVSAVEVSVNVDGLPLSKSSGSQLWPVLCSVFDKVFLVGAYHGNKKPDDCNELLEEFVAEAQEVVSEGVEVDEKKVNVSVTKLICDAPAKSDVMKVPGHGAYCGCTKCKVEGSYMNHRMSYSDINAPLRTDREFVEQTDSDHHTGTSNMLKIPQFGGVTNVALDYMHLVCLGVMRKLLLLWMKGPLRTRVGNAYISNISDMLTRISGLKPREFCRPPRSLKYVLQFKATEFRQLLLYTGPVVFYNCLPPDMYLNFLKLHVSLVILCCPKFVALNDYMQYADDLLRNFVDDFSDIYGEEFVSHNVHNLIHLVQDARKFGSLDNFSAFPFENYLQGLKKMVRKPRNVLAQISRRVAERESLSPTVLPKSQNPVFIESHSNEILPRSCGNPQFKRIQFTNFVLDLGEPNSCCGFANGSIMIVENFATCTILKCVVAIGRVFQEKDNLYDRPLPSSALGIYKVRKLGRLVWYPVDKIITKYWKIPIGDVGGVFAVMPLLHQETASPL